MGKERQVPSGFQNDYGLVTTVHFPFFHILNGKVYCYFLSHHSILGVRDAGDFSNRSLDQEDLYLWKYISLWISFR